MPDDDTKTATDAGTPSDAATSGIYIPIKYDAQGKPDVDVQRIGDVRLLEVGDALDLAVAKWRTFKDRM